MSKDDISRFDGTVAPKNFRKDLVATDNVKTVGGSSD